MIHLIFSMYIVNIGSMDFKANVDAQINVQRNNENDALNISHRTYELFKRKMNRWKNLRNKNVNLEMTIHRASDDYDKDVYLMLRQFPISQKQKRISCGKVQRNVKGDVIIINMNQISNLVNCL